MTKSDDSFPLLREILTCAEFYGTIIWNSMPFTDYFVVSMYGEPFASSLPYNKYVLFLDKYP